MVGDCLVGGWADGAEAGRRRRGLSWSTACRPGAAREWATVAFERWTGGRGGCRCKELRMAAVDEAGLAR